jgi:amino acid permease
MILDTSHHYVEVGKGIPLDSLFEIILEILVQGFSRAFRKSGDWDIETYFITFVIFLTLIGCYVAFKNYRTDKKKKSEEDEKLKN